MGNLEELDGVEELLYQARALYLSTVEELQKATRNKAQALREFSELLDRIDKLKKEIKGEK